MQRFKGTSAPRRLRVAACASVLSLATAFAAAAGDYAEAPMLADKVAGGQLPAVDERLPAAPMVEQPLESIGSYGGTWRQVMVGGGDSLVQRSLGSGGLVRWNREWSEAVPEVAKSVSVNDDATEFTFTLYEGHKWSDGTPFTSDDILFWYNDILMNKEITPEIPVWLRAGEAPLVVTAPDPTTVVFTFDAPNALFLANMATIRGTDILAGAPQHWLKQFHKDHSDTAEDLAKEAGAAGWVDNIANKIGYPSRWRDADRPVLDAWKLTVPYVQTTQVVAERNPYYHKVDPEGQQLPYIDKVTYDIVEDNQGAVLKAINGEIDFQNVSLDAEDQRPVLVQGREKGGYEMFLAQPAWSNAMIIMLNQTHKDPGLREVFANKDFRIGLSHAIDREELNQIIYAGTSEAWQAAPRADTELYDEELAKQYTEFDLDLANEYLGKAGLTERGSDGMRLRPDGERLTFAVDVISSWKTQNDALELVKGYWNKVGIDMQVRPIEMSLSITKRQKNDFDGNVWVGGGGYDMLGLLDPKWYFPYEFQSSYASAWGIWAQNPEDPAAEKPDAEAMKQLELYNQVLAAPSRDEQMALMRELLEITKDEFYVIGTNLAPDRYGIVKTNLANVPEAMPNTFYYLTPGPARAEQFYFQN
ncbi:ABC transporter substrate-binding protein [Marinovum sp.]|uniref:ABC transporter substrate-binding protein n=1 Tax=Marinovum sp. TaxID=2024839 RepID=UPI002B2721D2|nr:ABC transporter substrate-binding protein [Marinovum sp.]